MVFELVLAIIFLAIGLYIRIKQPQWMLSKFKKMNAEERKNRKINEVQVIKNGSYLFFALTAFQLVLVVLKLMNIT